MVGAAQGADWQGGDFAGVTQMIESGYFDDLGVGALGYRHSTQQRMVLVKPQMVYTMFPLSTVIGLSHEV